MIKIFRFMKKKDRLYALLCLLLVAGTVWFDLAMPDYMSDITKLIVTPGSAMGAVWTAGFKMLSCAMGSALLSVIVGFFAARLASNFSFTIREKIFYRVQTMWTPSAPRCPIPWRPSYQLRRSL